MLSRGRTREVRLTASTGLQILVSERHAGLGGLSTGLTTHRLESPRANAGIARAGLKMQSARKSKSFQFHFLLIVFFIRPCSVLFQ